MSLTWNIVIEIFGMIIEVIGGVIAIASSFPKLNEIFEDRCPFKQINVGLDRLKYKTLDVIPHEMQLRKNKEGFDEILSIINESYGPHEDIELIVFEVTSAQRSIGVSHWNVVLTDKNNNHHRPSTMRDLLIRIDIWKERYLIRKGFKILIFGVIVQMSSHFIPCLYQILSQFITLL